MVAQRENGHSTQWTTRNLQHLTMVYHDQRAFLYSAENTRQLQHTYYSMPEKQNFNSIRGDSGLYETKRSRQVLW